MTHQFAGLIADLATEFPGWLIEVGADDDPKRPRWRASRDDQEISADTHGQLRMQLDQADAIECRQAIEALGEALRKRGAKAEVIGVSLSTETRAGILRVVIARHGTFSWASGVTLGPITDIEGAADRMMPVLGLAARS